MMRLFKKYLTILTIVLAMNVSSFASDLNTINNTMQEKVNLIMTVLKNERLLKHEKDTEIGKISEGLFDYSLMSRLSVGKKIWKKATKENKKDFVYFFEMRMKKSYIEKSHLLSDEKVTVHDAVQVKPTRIHQALMIKSKDKDTEILYKYYKSKSGLWLIYDVEIAGISILKTYRAQFAEILESGDIEELIKQLKPA